MDSYDVIVIGGGPIGLAAAWQLSQRQAKTLVLEQFTFFNQLGSSAGLSRQFRLPYPESYMVQLVQQSIPLWNDLQALASGPLMDTVGTLWFGDPTVTSTEGNIGAAETAMTQAEVKYTSLNAAQIESYGFRNLPSSYVGLFQAQGASINLALTAQTLYAANSASKYVTLCDEAPVTNIANVGLPFVVTTPKGTFAANKLVLVPGPYVNSVCSLLGFQLNVTYWNMATAFYRIVTPGPPFPTWFVFQNAIGNNGNQFYGFPEVSWNNPGFVRVASDFVITPLTSPWQRTLTPNPLELAYTAEWVAQHMPGLEPIPQFASTCLIALLGESSQELLLDFAPSSVPNNRNIVLYATGWAGKFVPLLGRVLSDLTLEGTTQYDISNFAIEPDDLQP